MLCSTTTLSTRFKNISTVLILSNPVFRMTRLFVTTQSTAMRNKSGTTTTMVTRSEDSNANSLKARAPTSGRKSFYNNLHRHAGHDTQQKSNKCWLETDNPMWAGAIHHRFADKKIFIHMTHGNSRCALLGCFKP